MGTTAFRFKRRKILGISYMRACRRSYSNDVVIGQMIMTWASHLITTQKETCPETLQTCFHYVQEAIIRMTYDYIIVNDSVKYPRTVRNSFGLSRYDFSPFELYMKKMRQKDEKVTQRLNKPSRSTYWTTYASQAMFEDFISWRLVHPIFVFPWCL